MFVVIFPFSKFALAGSKKIACAMTAFATLLTHNSTRIHRIHITLIFEGVWGGWRWFRLVKHDIRKHDKKRFCRNENGYARLTCESCDHIKCENIAMLNVLVEFHSGNSWDEIVWNHPLFWYVSSWMQLNEMKITTSSFHKLSTNFNQKLKHIRCKKRNNFAKTSTRMRSNKIMNFILNVDCQILYAFVHAHCHFPSLISGFRKFSSHQNDKTYFSFNCCHEIYNRCNKRRRIMKIAWKYFKSKL